MSLIHELSARGYEADLVCGKVTPGEGDMGYLTGQYGIDALMIDEMGREISPFRDVRALLKLIRIIRERKPHIIHTHTAKAGFLGRLAGMIVNVAAPGHRRIRMVHTFHGHTFHSYFGPLKTRAFIIIERALSRFTDRIVVLSRQQRTDICRNYRIAHRRKVTVIPLGFDLSPFSDIGACRSASPSRCQAAGDSRGRANHLRVGIIGRLTPVKNHQLLLQAARTLKERGRIHRFRFVIVGDGELRDRLEEAVDSAGLGDAIAFAGWQRNMARIYASLDAVVLTSDNEGTPVTLIEAMAAGKPVLSTSVGGVPDLLGGVRRTIRKGVRLADRGILVERRNPVALCGGLLYLSEHPEASGAMADRGKVYVRKAFSMERCVDDITALYEALV